MCVVLVTPEGGMQPRGHVSPAELSESLAFLTAYCHASPIRGAAPAPMPAPPPVAAPAPRLPPADEFRATVAVLRRRYNDQNAEGDIADLTEGDIDCLARCFADELRAVVARGRQNGATPATPKQTSVRFEEPPKIAVGAKKDVTPPNMPKTMKEAIEVLRLGATVTKFAKKDGKPARRFFSVRHRRAMHESEMVVMPHFCWGTDESAEPTGQIPLLHLKEVQSGPSIKMHRGLNDLVEGQYGETINDDQCLSAVFEDRVMDMAFLSAAKCAQWYRALYMVAEKNRQAARKRQGGAK